MKTIRNLLYATGHFFPRLDNARIIMNQEKSSRKPNLTTKDWFVELFHVAKIQSFSPESKIFYPFPLLLAGAIYYLVVF
jgi:hypothetical protein